MADDQFGPALPVVLVGGAGMSGVDLEAELAAANAGFSLAAARRLFALGVPAGFFGALHVFGEVGLARVRLAPSTSLGKSGSGLWEPAEPDQVGSESRLLLAVREQGVLVDLAALSSADPDAWALRSGAGVFLGHDRFASARDGLANELRVFGNPIEWLAGRGEGICVLDWGAEALGWLRGLGPGVTLLASGAGAAERLREALKWGGLPEVRQVGARKGAEARRLAA